jgi:hypothetical protein
MNSLGYATSGLYGVDSGGGSFLIAAVEKADGFFA